MADVEKRVERPHQHHEEDAQAKGQQGSRDTIAIVHGRFSDTGSSESTMLVALDRGMA